MVFISGNQRYQFTSWFLYLHSVLESFLSQWSQFVLSSNPMGSWGKYLSIPFIHAYSLVNICGPFCTAAPAQMNGVSGWGVVALRGVWVQCALPRHPTPLESAPVTTLSPGPEALTRWSPPREGISPGSPLGVVCWAHRSPVNCYSPSRLQLLPCGPPLTSLFFVPPSKVL